MLICHAFDRAINTYGLTQVQLMCSYCKRHNETEVPDPYYGGQQGFEKVIHVNSSLWNEMWHKKLQLFDM